MPQHLWEGTSFFRFCEVCEAMQTAKQGTWLPYVGPICPGDPRNGGRRAPPLKPAAPAGSPKTLEPA